MDELVPEPEPLSEVSDEDGLLTTAELAKLYNKPPGTLRQWRHRGYGPKGFRLGGMTMYRRSEALAFLAACEADGKAA